MLGATKKPIAEATATEIRHYAEYALGMNLPVASSKENLIQILAREKVHEVWVVDVASILRGRLDSDALAAQAPDPNDHIYDPERERWVLMMIEGETDLSTGRRTEASVDLSVNDRQVSLPRGEPIWCAELFYAHLRESCVELRQEQDLTASTTGEAPKRRYYVKPRFSLSFFGYGGVLKDHPVPQNWRPGQRVFGPEGHVPVEVRTSHLQADERLPAPDFRVHA